MIVIFYQFLECALRGYMIFGLMQVCQLQVRLIKFASHTSSPTMNEFVVRNVVLTPQLFHVAFYCIFTTNSFEEQVHN